MLMYTGSLCNFLKALVRGRRTSGHVFGFMLIDNEHQYDTDLHDIHHWTDLWFDPVLISL